MYTIVVYVILRQYPYCSMLKRKHWKWLLLGSIWMGRWKKWEEDRKDFSLPPCVCGTEDGKLI